MDRAEVISVLCKLGANIHLSSSSTKSNALHVAAHSNASAATISALVRECGIDPNKELMNGDTTALYLAASHGFTGTVRALLRNGAKPTFAMPTNRFAESRDVIQVNGKISDSFSTVNSQPGHHFLLHKWDATIFCVVIVCFFL